MESEEKKVCGLIARKLNTLGLSQGFSYEQVQSAVPPGQRLVVDSVDLRIDRGVLQSTLLKLGVADKEDLVARRLAEDDYKLGVRKILDDGYVSVPTSKNTTKRSRKRVIIGLPVLILSILVIWFLIDRKNEDASLITTPQRVIVAATPLATAAPVVNPSSPLLPLAGKPTFVPPGTNIPLLQQVAPVDSENESLKRRVQELEQQLAALQATTKQSAPAATKPATKEEHRVSVTTLTVNADQMPKVLRDRLNIGTKKQVTFDTDQLSVSLLNDLLKCHPVWGSRYR